MDRHTAKPGEYVAIEYKDGNIEHMPGPFSIYSNPVRHTAVEVKKAHQLATPTDCVVVIAANSRSASVGAISNSHSSGAKKTDHPVHQRKLSGVIGVHAERLVDDFAVVAGTVAAAAPTIAEAAAPQVNRRIVCGPTNFIPNVNETVVKLAWMMNPAAPMRTDPFSVHVHSDSSKHEAPVEFDILSTRPFRFPASVPLTTAKGLTLTVDYDFGLRIVDVALAISGADPVAAVWLALQADLAKVGQKLAATYLETLDPSHSFAAAKTYEAMRIKATDVGLEVLDVQVKRVSMPAALKREQDAVIAANAQHQTEMDATKRAAQVQQAAAEAKLQQAAQDEQIATAEFEAAARKERHEHLLNTARQSHALQLEDERRASHLACTKDEHALLAGFLGQLKSVDVDLTAYLTSMAPAAAGTIRLADPRRQVAAATGLDPDTPSAAAAAAAVGATSGNRV